MILDLLVILLCRLIQQCDGWVPKNPVLSELGILAHIVMWMGELLSAAVVCGSLQRRPVTSRTQGGAELIGLRVKGLELTTSGDHRYYDKDTDTIVVVYSMSGLSQVFSGWASYALSATVNAHANHSLPIHFGFVVEWPTRVEHWVPLLFNVRTENWPINRWIRSARFPSWEHLLFLSGKCCPLLLDRH